MSSNFPLAAFKSRSSVDSSEESEVEDGDCLGVSKGETETELEEEEAMSLLRLLDCTALR